MVGEPGRGVPTIIQMVNHTRLDCVIGAAGGMRAAVAQATWHAAHRSAFGARLVEQPAMANVLADLAIEAEAATLVAMRLARAYDEAERDPRAERFKRLATAVCKYHVCKRVPAPRGRGARVPRRQRLRRGVGNAAPLPRGPARLHLGGLGQRDGARRAARAALGAGRAGRVPRRGRPRRPARTRALDAHVAALRAGLGDPEALEHRARRVVEDLALALQGSLLVRHAPAAVADAFCAARLDGAAGLAYGTLPAGTDTAAIVARHTPPAP